jgi:ABC-2 type transport system ATP-binding protein
MAMLEATDLWKSYGTLAAVSGVSLEVRAGEILGLLGPNGAGKSTTVAMLCGLTRPDRGEVRVGGVALKGDAGAEKRRLGFVPQEIAVHEDLAAIDNVRLFGALYGLRGRALKERAHAILDQVGLADRARDKPEAFSGGMKRRLNIACALVHDPEVLLLDEPTAGVDPQSRNAIFESLERLRARGKAILYTTHYMEEAERLCDRIVIIDHGKVIAAGSAAELHRLAPPSTATTLEIEGAVDDAMLAALAARGMVVKEVRSKGASLESVFLHLTGRELRD